MPTVNPAIMSFNRSRRRLYWLIMPMNGKNESSDFLIHGREGVHCLCSRPHNFCIVLFDSSAVKLYFSLNSICVYSGRWTLMLALCILSGAAATADSAEGDTDAEGPCLKEVFGMSSLSLPPDSAAILLSVVSAQKYHIVNTCMSLKYCNWY